VSKVQGALQVEDAEREYTEEKLRMGNWFLDYVTVDLRMWTTERPGHMTDQRRVPQRGRNEEIQRRKKKISKTRWSGELRVFAGGGETTKKSEILQRGGK